LEGEDHQDFNRHVLRSRTTQLIRDAVRRFLSFHEATPRRLYRHRKIPEF